MDIRAFIDELDRLLGKNMANEARELLEEGLSEAEADGDREAMLTVLNEMSGFYRINGDKVKGIDAAERALLLLKDLRLTESVTGATTLLNSATTFKAFGMAAKSLPYYREAERIYERFLQKGDYRFAGLYNNMAMALMDEGFYEDSEICFKKALSVLDGLSGAFAEKAMTYVNMAMLKDAAGMGEMEITACLMRAMDLFNDERAERNAYYAFCCRKSAPTFGYYGFFEAKAELTERDDRIYSDMRGIEIDK